MTAVIYGETSGVVLASAVMYLAVVAAILVGTRPLLSLVRQKERKYDHILRSSLMLDIPPRAVTAATLASMLLLGFLGWIILSGSLVGTILFGAAGLLLPGWLIRLLRRRRQRQLEEQLVGGIQTLASGVRAGLNLVQAMKMIARDAPAPLSQEIAHLLREYEYGVPLEEAMDNAGQRIELDDYRLLLAALRTHRQRGGDLGQTLDRIAQSIREIQRLENRVRTLTAQGRATARWLGAMPGAVMAILYVIDSTGVVRLFAEPAGKAILTLVVALNLVGFLWIRKIMAIDI